MPVVILLTGVMNAISLGQVVIMMPMETLRLGFVASVRELRTAV